VIGYVVKSTSDNFSAAGASEASFFDALEKEGVELRMKDLQVYAGGMKKADWDVGLAVDAIRMGHALDVIILVTGDGDFVPLVEYLKWGMGRQVEVAAFSRSASSKLKEIADVFTNLEDIPHITMRSRSSQTVSDKDGTSKRKMVSKVSVQEE
jgi:uncharacterized LabA/DUF88 family protein